MAATKKERFVGLLRGINVGGKNKLPMKDLVAAFEASGCANVKTYIQSGNVVFDATPAVAARLPTELPARILSMHGLSVPLVLRSKDEIARVTTTNPYPSRTVDDKLFYVFFLADAPSPEAVAKLDPNRSPGDAFTVVDKHVYVVVPNGAADSKLTNAWFDKQLGTVSTARNWRTVEKLIELSR
jgi:uncharacterized protein (DUF1697 family)